MYVSYEYNKQLKFNEIFENLSNKLGKVIKYHSGTREREEE